MDPYHLESVTIKSCVMFDKDRIGFMLASADVRNKSGTSWLPASVFFRGPSVAMLFFLVPEDNPDERYVVMTVQPRIAAGSLSFVEIPAGMVDEKDEFVGTAAKEIREELGIIIAKKDLICLSDMVHPSQPEGQDQEDLPPAMFPSSGACDEYIKIFMYEQKVPREQLDEWRGKQTGLRDKGEKISLRLIPYCDLWKEGAKDAKALSAIALYEGLKREGKI